MHRWMESKSPIVSISELSEQQWPLLSSVFWSSSSTGWPPLPPSGPLSSLNSNSSHWPHHDICPLPELVARVHSCCWVKAGNTDSFVCFPSLGRFEELTCIHLELRKDWSLHHSVVLVHNVLPQGLVLSFSSNILCMFISSCVKISTCFTFIL